MTFLAGCSNTPTLSALDPPDGRPHDVVLIQGTGRELSQIVWDAGAPGEKPIPGAFGGAFMFSVPPGATPGPHNVALQNNSGRSMPITFNVPPSPGLLTIARPQGPTRGFPAPRIDAVTILEAAFDSSGVRVLLYVQGANVDVGATVWVQDSASTSLAEVATVSHKTMLNDWFGVSADEFDYPIYHYSSVIAAPGNLSPGKPILIVVKNLDGVSSKAFEYTLPADADTIDSDGDGLLDKWETDGYDANADGVKDIDLPGLGANPYRRDLFLELDIMDGVQYRPDKGEGGVPDSTVFDALRKMFESAPIINVGDALGIRLVIDHSGKPCLAPPSGPDVCQFQFTMFDTGASGSGPDPFSSGYVRYSQLKEHSFDNRVRDKVYHYAIWAPHDDNGNVSGHSDFADDFLISFDTFDPPYQTRRSQAETLAHEFGHDLEQHHGGTDDKEHTPDYLSVLTYTWQLRTGRSDAFRRQYVTCLPFYYARPGAQEVNGAVPADVNMIVDYSEGMARALVRPTEGEPETTSFCGLTVDWSTLSMVSKAEDFPNWRALTFDGPDRNGLIKP